MITPLSKVIDINFNLNETSNTLLANARTGKQFNTADTDAWFEFGFTDANIQNGTYNLTLINLKDESKFEHEGIAFNSNPFYYKLDSGADMQTNEIKHAGTWIGQLVVTLDNGKSATQKFMFDIENHILDGTVASVTMLEGYSVLMAQIENAKELLDQYNIDYAALLADLEAIYNSRLFSVEAQLADTTNRIQTNFVNVRYPPNGYIAATGNGVTDDTVAIQALIDDFPTVYIPNGVYIVSKLTLKTYRSIVGQNSHDTIIKAKVSIEKSLFVLPVGPVQHIRMENIMFVGVGTQNPNQNGLYFKAQATTDSPYHGGLWLSMFKNIIVSGFDGTGLALLAGSNALLPHQGLTFERVEVTSNAKNNINSIALLIEGQVEQVSWNQCGFSGGDVNSAQGTAVVFRKERLENGTPTGDIGGGANTFVQCYFGNCDVGITMERSRGIFFINTYFENLNQSLKISSVCGLITLIGSVLWSTGTKYAIEDDWSTERMDLINIAGNHKVLVQNCVISNCNITNERSDTKSIPVDRTIVVKTPVHNLNNSSGTVEIQNISSVLGSFRINAINQVTFIAGGNIINANSFVLNTADSVYVIKIDNNKFYLLK